MKKTKKDQYIQIRCTEHQKAKAKDQATKKGLNLSQYFLYLARKDQSNQL